VASCRAYGGRECPLRTPMGGGGGVWETGPIARISKERPKGKEKKITTPRYYNKGKPYKEKLQKLNLFRERKIAKGNVVWLNGGKGDPRKKKGGESSQG